MKTHRLHTRSALTAAALTAVCQWAAAADVVVSPSNLNGWVFSSDGAPMGSANFVPGPGTAPLGAGSLEMVVADAAERLVVATGAHAGTRLDAITALGLSLYQTSGTGSPTLQFDVDFDLSDTTASWQGTLVYDPALNGTVTPAAWQSWDALAGKWYMTGTAISANVAAGQPFPLATPGTLTAILAQFPNAGIRATVGAVSLKAGGAAGALTVSADALIFNATGADPVTYNFEPDSDGDGVADSEDHCADSDIRPKVDVGSGATTIDNSVDKNGCTIQDLVNKAEAAARNHGKYVSAISKLANDLRKAGTITNSQKQEMKTGAAHSSIGKPPTAGGSTGTGSGNSGSGSGNSGNGNEHENENHGNGNGNNGNGNGNGHH